jgi:hypothetical protein
MRYVSQDHAHTTKAKEERTSERNMNVTLRRAILVCALALVLAAMAAGAASAQTPITVSEHTNKETFTATGHVYCQGDKLYELTVTYNELMGYTAAGLDEDGNLLPPVHFHTVFIGKWVAVPIDGTGPTYYGHAREGETWNAKSFEEFVGTFTRILKTTARGTDGSKVNFHWLIRYSTNAEGEVTVDIEKLMPDASCIPSDV